MDELPDNSGPTQQEFEEYRERSTRAKFMNQIFLGIGGATVFGIVAAMTNALIHSLPAVWALNAATLLPLAGIALVAAVGITSLYFGARYVARSVMLDLDFQAKKITAGTRAIAPQIAQGTSTITPLPAQSSALKDTGQPLQAQEAAERAEAAIWAGRFAQNDPKKAWAERTQLSAANADMQKGV